MAEGVGFEPTNEFPHRWFSRPVLSTAQPPLQLNFYPQLITIFVKNPNFNFIITLAQKRCRQLCFYISILRLNQAELFLKILIT